VGQPQQVPPPLLLGRRVLGLRALAKHGNTVVIVKDSASYLEAIAQWRVQARFPVLIDDGTPEAHENIARFVRGYQPAKVVRWSATGAARGFAEPTLEDLQNVQARAWGIPKEHATAGLLTQLWEKLNFEPPGLVGMNTKDSAWPAAIALAAGRGQVLVTVNTPTGVSGTMTPGEADAIEKVMQEAAAGTQRSWRGLGDAVESVTLCLNSPAKIDAGNGQCLAVTDRIGRVSAGVEDGPRWAWAGQVFGNHQQSAYRAMCSLFLPTRKAWLFDGYGTGEPWNTWDCTKAAGILKEAGLNAEVDDTPRQGARDWRLRGARALSAELVFVNSKGGCNYFDLEPGQCKPGDVPLLNVPAAVHFVHSWSAQFADARGTVAGRWLERGAFCYYGSVDEPFLHAFLPTPAAAGRLVSGAPFGSAVRQDGGKLWKLAVIGDPLYVVAKDLERYEDVGLEGAAEVGAGLREMLTGGKYAEAVAAITLMGKDEQATQLAVSLLKEKPGALEPKLVAMALPAALRAGNNRAVVQLYPRLGELAKDPALRDVLWLAAYPLLEAPDDELLRLLFDHVRGDQAGSDATTLGAAWARKNGRAMADSVLAELRKRLNADEQRDFDEWMKRPFQQWGR